MSGPAINLEVTPGASAPVKVVKAGSAQDKQSNPSKPAADAPKPIFEGRFCSAPLLLDMWLSRDGGTSPRRATTITCVIFARPLFPHHQTQDFFQILLSLNFLYIVLEISLYN